MKTHYYDPNREERSDSTGSHPYNLNAPITSDFSMRYYLHESDRIENARSYPPHVHDILEFYILLDGDVSFMVEHRLYKLSPGDIVISKPNEMHNCVINTDSSHKHLCFWFDPDCDFLFSEFLAHDFGENNVCTPTPEDRVCIFDICHLLYETSQKGTDKIGEFHLAMQLLYYIRRNLSQSSGSENLPDLLQKILADIHTDLTNINSLSYFFDKYFISPSTLSRLFRKYLRTSPKVYLETKRLAYSRILLKRGLSVADACVEAGFPDYSNYIRLFRSRFGMTPLQYRNS